MEVKKLLALEERIGEGQSNFISIPTAFPIIITDVRGRFKPFIKVITKEEGREILLKEGKVKSSVIPLKSFSREVKIEYRCKSKCYFGIYIILDFIKTNK